MGAPKGSQNAKGNRGGTGRPSAYQERANAALLWEMFFGENSREEVSKKLKSGKYSLKDAFVAKGYQGETRVLETIFKRLFPEIREVDVTSGGEPVSHIGPQLNIIQQKRLQIIVQRAEDEAEQMIRESIGVPERVEIPKKSAKGKILVKK